MATQISRDQCAWRGGALAARAEHFSGRDPTARDAFVIYRYEIVMQVRV